MTKSNIDPEQYENVDGDDSSSRASSSQENLRRKMAQKAVDQTATEEKQMNNKKKLRQIRGAAAAFLLIIGLLATFNTLRHRNNDVFIPAPYEYQFEDEATAFADAYLSGNDVLAQKFHMLGTLDTPLADTGIDVVYVEDREYNEANGTESFELLLENQTTGDLSTMELTFGPRAATSTVGLLLSQPSISEYLGDVGVVQESRSPASFSLACGNGNCQAVNTGISVAMEGFFNSYYVEVPNTALAVYLPNPNPNGTTFSYIQTSGYTVVPESLSTYGNGWITTEGDFVFNASVNVIPVGGEQPITAMFALLVSATDSQNYKVVDWANPSEIEKLAPYRQALGR